MRWQRAPKRIVWVSWGGKASATNNEVLPLKAARVLSDDGWLFIDRPASVAIKTMVDTHSPRSLSMGPRTVDACTWGGGFMERRCSRLYVT